MVVRTGRLFSAFSSQPRGTVFILADTWLPIMFEPAVGSGAFANFVQFAWLSGSCRLTWGIWLRGVVLILAGLIRISFLVMLAPMAFASALSTALIPSGLRLLHPHLVRFGPAIGTLAGVVSATH